MGPSPSLGAAISGCLGRRVGAWAEVRTAPSRDGQQPGKLVPSMEAENPGVQGHLRCLSSHLPGARQRRKLRLGLCHSPLLATSLSDTDCGAWHPPGKSQSLLPRVVLCQGLPREEGTNKKALKPDQGVWSGKASRRRCCCKKLVGVF